MLLQLPLLSRLAIIGCSLLITACDAAPPLSFEWPHSEGSYAASFSEDRQYLITAGINSEVRLWDVANNTIAFSWQSDTQQQASSSELVALSPNGQVAATVEYDTVLLWKVDTGEPLNRLVFPFRIHAIDLSPNGDFILLALANSSAIYFDVAANQVRQVFQHDGAAVNSELNHMLHSVAISPDGQTALTGGDDRTARLWDLQSGDPLFNWLHGNTVNLVAFDPQSRFALTAADNDQTHLWDLTNGQQIATLRSSAWPSSLPLPNFPVFNSTTTAVGFSADGQLLVTGHAAERVCVWQLPSAAKKACWKVPRQQLLTPGNVIQAVAFTPDDRSIQTVGGNGWVQLWQWR